MDDDRRYALSKEMLEIINTGFSLTDLGERSISFDNFYTNIFEETIPSKGKAEVEQLLAQMLTLEETDGKLLEGA